MPLFEIAVPLEVFATPRPGLVEPAYNVQLCAEEPVASFGAFSLHVTYGYDFLENASTVIVPALATWDTAVPPALLDALRKARANGSRIVGLCTGAFALAQAGLLDGLPATTHWMYASHLAHRYPKVQVNRDVLWAGTRDVVTSAGTASGLDLCLELLRRDHGARVANDVARRMVVAPHREGGQAQYVREEPPADIDRSLGPALEWALANLSDNITVGDLAKAVHVSDRTLVRRFRDQLGITPTRWLTEQRVRRAQELIERTEFTIAQIAPMAGFESASILRAHFVALLGASPRTYRRLFNSTESELSEIKR
jgi:transcriptional regulator GlxA family with amidase domain